MSEDGYTLLNANGEELLDSEGNTRIGSAGDPCCCDCAPTLYVNVSGVILCTSKSLSQSNCSGYVATTTVSGSIDGDYTIPLIQTFPGDIQCDYGGLVTSSGFSANRISFYGGTNEVTSNVYIAATWKPNYGMNYYIRMMFACGNTYTSGSCPDTSTYLFKNGLTPSTGIYNLNNTNPDCSGCYASYGGTMTISTNPLP